MPGSLGSHHFAMPHWYRIGVSQSIRASEILRRFLKLYPIRVDHPFSAVSILIKQVVLLPQNECLS
jgi:hypothetical protein